MNKLLKLAHSLDKFVVGMEGNVSQRIENNFLIKASGCSLKNLSKQDVVLCNIKGKQINNFKKKPSIETQFHSILFQNLNIEFIAHTHPINTLKILCSELVEEFAKNRLFPDQVVFNGMKSCVVPYVAPGIELAIEINKSINIFNQFNKYFPKLILLKNHGIISLGSTAEECLVATEICEKAAEIFLGSKLLGSINFLTESDQLELEKDPNEIYRKGLLT